MKDIKHIPQAGISLKDGMLVINKHDKSLFNKHYNVSYFIQDNELIVSGYKPKIDCMFREGEIDPNLLIEEDQKEVKKYHLFGKKIKVSRSGYVEYKERKLVNYTTNNYLIIG